ncbi:MAG: sulfide/dihydroorotate dehydrogenase-like FAD/NAD-binding protein [Candidatus Makaraimicrobium thalassicum]|nr:MAG: sulfide/dihydroorotate dehydrogenase-like FAD/NAD-binding protein [Candidatus Omnitrophota bacterium]
MHKVVRKEQLNKEICLVEFEARDISASAKAGQFVILRVDETGERFPLTLYDWDSEKGTVTVVCQAVGVSTKKLCALDKGGSILDAAGPLGHAVGTKGLGKVICIGGGVGTAEACPIARAMKTGGNDVTGIIGARTKDLVICEDEMRKFCDKVYVMTDDGSYGRKGFVTDILRELLEEGHYHLVFAIGPVIMMKMVSGMTKPRSVRTLVSLNSIMIDGTGMCGGCRILYNEEPKFVCVDGPEFDGHLVDFDDLMRRQERYKGKEKAALDRYDEHCRIGLGRSLGDE